MNFKYKNVSDEYGILLVYCRGLKDVTKVYNMVLEEVYRAELGHINKAYVPG